MEDLKERLEKAITEAQKLVDKDDKWKNLYNEYATLIINNEEKIKELSEKFHKWAPLKYYLTIGKAKDFKKTLYISVRYQGQEVAQMKISNNDVCISTKGFDENNEKHFSCNIKLDNEEWKGSKATEFRKYFLTNPKRTKEDNEEHRIESMLINEFSQSNCMKYIEPVKIAEFPFSMQTIISSSKEIKEGNGHIDILARKDRKLLIIELKDENKESEPIEKVLEQATGYAVFIINLLRSEAGEKWYKIFGFGSKIPQELTIKVSSAMPKNKNGKNAEFKSFNLKCGKDILEYHWLYFEEDGNKVTKIESSLTEK